MPATHQTAFLGAAIAAFGPDAPMQAFYPSLGHQDALSRLPLLATPGSLVVISGDAGMGKSMIVAVAHATLPATLTPVIAGPADETTTDLRFLRSLLHGTGKRPKSRTGLELTSELQTWAQQTGLSGRTATLIVDDSHLRPGSHLEVIRSLLIVASPVTPISVLLLGEPDLVDRLNRKRNLAQRVSLHYALNPLSDADGASLIAHRLDISGCPANALLSSDARLELARLSAGNPGQMVRLTRHVLETAQWTGEPLTSLDIAALAGQPAAISAARDRAGTGHVGRAEGSGKEVIS